MRLLLYFLLTIFVTAVDVQAGEAIPCECPPLICEPCMIMQGGQDFVREPCGPGGDSVRSCQRARCVPNLENPDCNKDAALKKAKASSEAQSVKVTATPVQEIGKVSDINGPVMIKRYGQEIKLEKGVAIYRGDQLVSSEHAQVEISFVDGNKIILQPKSALTVSSYEPRSKALLALAKGAVRGQVRHKYTEEAFQIQTKTAIAGVRGTDFLVISSDKNQDHNTDVYVFEGQVNLSAIEKQRDNFKSHTLIQAGEWSRSSGNQKAFMIVPKSKIDEETLSFRKLHSSLERRVASQNKDAIKQAQESACKVPDSSVGECAAICEQTQKLKIKNKMMPQCNSQFGYTCHIKKCLASGVWTEVVPADQTADLCEVGKASKIECPRYIIQ